jgi:epoxyqueuosine reductase
MSLSQEIKCKALELGFDLVGITDTSPIDTKQVELLIGWLNSGFAGQMNYLQRNLDKRINPASLLEGAQSVIVVGLNYKPSIPNQLSVLNPQINLGAKYLAPQFIAGFTKFGSNWRVATGRIASYAQYEDYHSFIKKQLHKLIDFINSVADTSQKFKICVDSAPLAERALAARAGLGFIGKNHLLINPKLGPQILLGEIITTLKLQPDKPISKSCLNCDKCIVACPTGALRIDGQFDTNKCINYLTIEYKGQIPTELCEKIGDHLFGCDECILACPYQQNAPTCKNKHFKFYSDRNELDLQEILELTEEEFEKLFADSVIKRLGLAGLQRNARICFANVYT